MSSCEPHRVALLSLHTSPATQPGTGDAGGLNVYVLALAHALVDLGAQVDIYTRHNRALALGSVPADAADGCPHHLAPNLRLFEVTAGPNDATKQQLQQYIPEFVSNVVTVAERYAQRPYTIIHGHYWLSGMAALQLADVWGAPTVQTMHTLGHVKNAHLSPGDTPDPVARLEGEQYLLETCGHVIANTQSEANDLSDHYRVDSSRISVINPGVDTTLFFPVADERRRQLRAAVNLGPDDVHVLFVGRFQPLKAPDILLKSIAEVLCQQPGLRSNLKVTLNGDSSGANGFTHQDLQSLAHELKIEGNVRFQKPQPRRQLADTYRTADLLVVPSYNETFGLVALEAAACGTPTVATNVGGLATSIRSGHSGVLVEGHDPQEWARVLCDLINSPKRRKVLAANAIHYAQGFSWINAARKTLEIYDRTTAGVHHVIG